MEKESLSQLLIVGIVPYFLEKEVLWFTENLKEMLSARNSQSFFKDNIIFLSKLGERNVQSLTTDHFVENSDIISFSQFLRKIDEMGY